MSSSGYQLAVDSKRDNSFSGVYDDLTAYTLSASWDNGLASAFDDFAPPRQLTVSLDNIGDEFNQDYVGAEALANAGFDNWTAGNPDNWTVTGESGSDPEVSQVGTSETHGGGGTGLANLYTSSAALTIAQSVLQTGTRYKITLTIDGVLGTGGVVITNNGAQVTPVYHLTGAKTAYFTASSTDFTIAVDGAANVTLSSVSCKPVRRYAGALARGMLMRLRMTFGGQTVQMFIGKIASVSLTPGNLSAQTCMVVCEDPMNALMQTDYQPSLLLNATVDEGIADVFNKATFGWPYAHSGWMVGIEGSSEVGTTTVIYSNTLSNLDTGITVLPYSGSASDNGHGVAAQSMLRDFVVTEAGGRFWFNTRTGQFRFTNRHQDILNSVSSLATYSSSNVNGYDFDSASQLLFGDLVYNDVTVNYQPRGLGVPGTTIWEAQDIIVLQPGQEKKITARYFDAVNNTNAKVSAIDVIAPAPFTDYVAEVQFTESTDGGDTTSLKTPTSRVTLPITDVLKFTTITKPNSNRTGLVRISAKIGATSTELTIQRRYTSRVFYMTGLRIRGTPLYTYDKRAAHASDGDSIRSNGIQRKIMDLPQVSDDDFGNQLANYVVSRFKDPITRLPSISFNANKTDARMQSALTRQIGDRITVSDDRTAHSADYIVIGEHHQIKAGGDITHDVTWTLEPANTIIYWKIGVAGFSEVGQTTRAML
jgi:hypothetical protein